MGNIVLTSGFGKKIKDLSENPDYHTYVEAGTYLGDGSTVCFLESLIKRKDNSKLYTIECNKRHFEIAKKNLNHYITTFGNDKIELLYGTIVKYEELPNWAEWNGIKKENYNYNRDLLIAPCIYDILPQKIDVLLLDSGGWSRQSEWEKLKDRVKVIMIDDTRISTHLIRKEIINSDEWIVLNDSAERNGWLCAEKK